MCTQARSLEAAGLIPVLASVCSWCVYRNEVHHTSQERTVILQVRVQTDRSQASKRVGSATEMFFA